MADMEVGVSGDDRQPLRPLSHRKFVILKADKSGRRKGEEMTDHKDKWVTGILIRYSPALYHWKCMHSFTECVESVSRAFYEERVSEKS